MGAAHLNEALQCLVRTLATNSETYTDEPTRGLIPDLLLKWIRSPRLTHAQWGGLRPHGTLR